MLKSNRIICGDSSKVLKKIDSKSVDLCYLDPPFFADRIFEAKGKYGDFYEFIKIAINNQIQEEKSEPEYFEDKLFSETLPARSFHDIKLDIRERQNQLSALLSGNALEKGEILPTVNSIIWSFYNRFFPVKIIVRKLATMINQNKIWFSLDEVQEESFASAESVSDELKKLEEEKEFGRSERLSTGLPLPKSEIKSLKGNKLKRKLEKIAASELRFKEQFVGRYIKRDSEFKGFCFELGLIRVKVENGSCLITISELGHEFALMENPILDGVHFDSNFSDEEVKFIVTKIIPKFDLENTIVKAILKELRSKKLSSNDVDNIFKNVMKKHDVTVTSERVATMGRLSELNLVKWEIISGKSSYSLGKTDFIMI